MSDIFVQHPLAMWERGPRLNLIRRVAGRIWEGELAELLLQHDTVILPTSDFSILPVLLHWCGPDLVMDMAATGTLRFVRYFGSIAYFGDGSGVDLFEEWPTHAHPRISRLSPDDAPYWARAPVVSTEEAVNIYLREVRVASAGDLREETIRHLTRVILDQTVEVELSGTFRSKVTELTASDVENTSKLKEFFLQEAGDTFETLVSRRPHVGPALAKLADLDPDALRVYRSMFTLLPPNPEDADPENVEFDHIDVLLWMAESNYLMALAETVGSQHVLVRNVMREILMGRAKRAGLGSKKAREFDKLLAVSNIPSIPDAFMTTGVKFSDIWRLRDSEKGARFRGWFNSALDASRGSDIHAAYIETLTAEHWSEKLPVRVLRILLPAAISLKEPELGLAAEMVDAFVANKLKGWTPKLFLDDLRKQIDRSEDLKGKLTSTDQR